MKRINALAQLLGVNVSELTEISDDSFEYGREEYRVLTQNEAEIAVKYYILDSIWAFKPSFLAGHMANGVDEEILKTIQSIKCEDCNETFKAMILDLKNFVDDAIKCDGMGHFLSPYDGEELEVGKFLVYRQN